jgi:hypothetical protein
MKAAKTPEFKLNDRVEFLETPVKNWRWGKIVEINSKTNTYKIYSGTDMFWARECPIGKRTQLQTI